MGDRQSVVVLNKGDWVLTKDRGVGWISVVNYMGDYALVEFGEDAKDYSNYLYPHDELTPLPQGLTPILSDSIKE